MQYGLMREKTRKANCVCTIASGEREHDTVWNSKLIGAAVTPMDQRIGKKIILLNVSAYRMCPLACAQVRH